MHPDGKFTPNVVNSIMFLMSSIMQVNTFVVNYRGHPFMEGFWENKLFCRSALFNYAVLAIVTAEVYTPINSMLELVAMPNKQVGMSVVVDVRKEVYKLISLVVFRPSLLSQLLWQATRS